MVKSMSNYTDKLLGFKYLAINTMHMYVIVLMCSWLYFTIGSLNFNKEDASDGN